jgi:ATP-dependent RNA helicase DeaD
VLSFSDLNLSPPLREAIEALGFEKPSAIQAETLPILLGAKTDFIGQAATGTGKTAAFSIPMLESIDPRAEGVQALVLCPTRELAVQVAGQIDLLGQFKNLRSVAIYGGSSFGDQVRALKDGANIVVGTPGRVIDHLTRGTLKLGNIKTVVLDEADEMISMGFKDELEAILKTVPKGESNIWLFSATMSKEVRRVADHYLRSPKQVQINRKEMLSETVEQIFYVTQEGNKPEVLCKLIDSAEDFYGVIFCQTKSLVCDLTQYLTDRGYKVDSLHGDKDQRARERTMQAFRDRKVKIAVCTDVAARGLDVKDVTHVINYSIPRELDLYVHRIGRTARSGKAGLAMSLVTPSHRHLIGRIEAMTKSKMKEGQIPSSKSVGSRKVSALLPKFVAQEKFPRIQELLEDDWKQAVDQMSREEIVARFAALLLPEILEAPKRTEFSVPMERQRTSNRYEGGSRSRIRRGEERPRRSFGDRKDRGPRKPARFS